MGIVRTVEWSLQVSPEEADFRIRKACESLGLEADGPRAKSPVGRSVRC